MGIIANVQREVKFMRSMVTLLGRVRPVAKEPNATGVDMIERWVNKVPNNEAIVFEDQVWTYREFDNRANQIAHWAQGNGIKRGDVVALVMENKPEYIAIWYGLGKIGARIALINSNLEGKGLAHTLNISNAEHLILDANLADNHSSAADQLERKMTVWAQGGTVQGANSFDDAIDAQEDTPLPGNIREGMTQKDPYMYIYTSGTTGLPKAANISHHRFMNMSLGFSGALATTPEDRVYVTLPLYHATGGIGGVGAALTAGAAVILRHKFSASQFFNDCIKYDATIFMYIGELCRYLLNAPENPNERNHKIRAAMGNGLRPEVWGPFVERFNVPKIVEFYGSTEGNVALFNIDGKQGSIGRIPKYLRNVMQTRIVKFNVEEEEVVRGNDGFCIEAAYGEAGEALGKIDDTKPGGSFEGYNNKEATEKKILRDVFEKGDAWFRTGDLLKVDKEGYYYFVDRIGDTFRWKGENVATSEVAEVLSQVPGIEEANVYGVQVEGTDGRAGMASIVGKPELDYAKLEQILDRDLPPYARPIFLRIQPEMEVTGTFKHRKVELVKEGFDPSKVADPIKFRNPETGHYEDLDQASYDAIQGGQIRL